MQKLLTQLSQMVEAGKIDKKTPYPPHLKDADGAIELTAAALESGIAPQEILNDGLMPGMSAVGERFAAGKAFIPDMLIASRAMNAAMELLKPHFQRGDIQTKGTFIIGTVQGDLHDIGKNLVIMIMKGAGWDVIDLGTDVSSEAFVQACRENPNAIVGLSALLTTTMFNMEKIVADLRALNSSVKVYIGGAPVSEAFSNKIGADGYFREPYSLAKSI